MHTHIDDRPLDDRTDEKQRAPQEVYRLARLSAEMVTPWQLPPLRPESDTIRQVRLLETDYVVAWQLQPTRP